MKNKKRVSTLRQELVEKGYRYLNDRYCMGELLYYYLSPEGKKVCVSKYGVK